VGSAEECALVRKRQMMSKETEEEGRAEKRRGLVKRGTRFVLTETMLEKVPKNAYVFYCVYGLCTGLL
jgi:hypothetical protein